MTMEVENIGKAFVNHYYNIFDTNRENLRSLYREPSILTFEGETCLGPENIIKKLTNLPLQKVRHQITSMDCQPTGFVQPNGIIISVSGNLILDNEQNPMKFAQCFYLLPVPGEAQNFWVSNDIFRLNYG